MAGSLLSQMQSSNDQVDKLDADKGYDDTSQTVDQEITSQNGGSSQGPELDALQRQRDQGDNDQGDLSQ
jgi:hypothetical protein